MNELKAKKLAAELMSISEVACLSTLNHEGFPETRALMNLNNSQQFPALVDFTSEGDLVAYLTTNTASYKMDNIRENPKTSIYYYKEGRQDGLMLMGTMEIVEDMELKKAFWHEGWKVFFPKGVEDSDYTLLRLKPDLAKGYHNMENYKLTFK